MDEADAEQVRRDKRYAGESIPERFFRLPRIKFLMILCKEQSRINAAIGTLAEDRFNKLDLQRTGEVRGSGSGAWGRGGARAVACRQTNEAGHVRWAVVEGRAGREELGAEGRGNHGL